MAKFRFHISTKFVGSTREEIVEIDDEVLEGMTGEEKEEYIWKEYYLEWAQENADMFFEKLED